MGTAVKVRFAVLAGLWYDGLQFGEQSGPFIGSTEVHMPASSLLPPKSERQTNSCNAERQPQRVSHALWLPLVCFVSG